MTTKTSNESLEWAKKAFQKLKDKKKIKFRSKLEENIANLLEGTGHQPTDAKSLTLKSLTPR